MFNFWLWATRSLWVLVSSNLIPLLLSNWPGELGKIAKMFERMGGLLFGVDFISVAFIDRNVPMSTLWAGHDSLSCRHEQWTAHSSFTSKELLAGINLLFQTLSFHMFRRQSPVFKHAS